jgi:hypothetical protein
MIPSSNPFLKVVKIKDATKKKTFFSGRDGTDK